MQNLKQTQAILEQYKVLPKKSLGQNFLISERIIKKVIEINNLTKTDHILEIGPGIGALTKPLLENAKQVDAYEIDKRMITILQDQLASFSNLNLFQADILEVNLGYLYSEISTLKIIANLPYYITSKIVEKLICELPDCNTFCLMMQKEAADRILLRENHAKYGVTAILLALFGQVVYKFDVPANCFYPRPKVKSRVLLIKRNPNSVFFQHFHKNSENQILDFKQFLEISFSMRRKTLLNNWKKSEYSAQTSVLEQVLNKLEIDQKTRPEQISPEEFWKIYLNMADYKG